MKHRECWIHETETSDGWMVDVEHSLAAHTERGKYSDGFTHYIEMASFQSLFKREKVLREALNKIQGWTINGRQDMRTNSTARKALAYE